MKIAIISCLNNRPEISRIMLNTVDRLMEHHDITLHAAVTAPADEALVISCGWQPVICENIAGKKWNTALKSAVDIGYDAYFILGDDDSVSTKYFDLCVAYIARGHHHTGTNRCAFFDLDSGQASVRMEDNNALVGAGRMLSSHAVMETAYKFGWGGLWENTATMSLDRICEGRLEQNGFKPSLIVTDKIHVTDFKKIHKNIWPYHILKNMCEPIPSSDALWFLSDMEKEYISSLCEKGL